MLIELLDDPWSHVDDERLAHDLAFFELAENEPFEPEGTAGPEDQRTQSVADLLALVDQLGPCGESALLLESLADRRLTEDEALSAAVAWRRVLAWAAGSQLAAVAAFAGPVPPEVVTAQGIARGEDLDPSVSMLSAALGTHRGAAADLLHQARTLYGQRGPATEPHPAAGSHDVAGPFTEGLLTATGCALLAGRIDQRRAAVLVDELTVLRPTLARRIETQVLPGADNGSISNLRDKIRRRLAAADADAATTRHLSGRKDRRVELHTDGQDGLVSLHAALPPVEGLAVYQRLEQLAGRYHHDDGRDKNQRLADALIGCILGFRSTCPPPQPADAAGCGARCDRGLLPAPAPVQVNLTVDLPTLLRLREHPAELHGYGPVPAELARILATNSTDGSDATWRRLVHDPVTGHLLDRGHTSYRPGDQLAGYIYGRDQHCRFPGCNQPIDDLDHNQPWNPADPHEGGTTSAGNLAGLCRYHHRVKTHTGFHLTNHGDGTLTWTTPTGRTHTTRPHDYRPDADDDPP